MKLRYSDLKLVMVNQLRREMGRRVAYLILGEPGGGKSTLTRDVAGEIGKAWADAHDTTFDWEADVVEFNGSTRDPVDVLGTPNNKDRPYTHWVPPEEFYKLREGRDGDKAGKPCFLILEEITDSTVPMQNALCRVVLDRCAGSLKLSKNLIIMASGNRTEDKSGANRLTTKLGNRMRIHTFQTNLDDWVDWAQDNDIDPVLIQFLRFKPAALMDFSADRTINATPRSWASVSYVDPALPLVLYHAECAGSVGEGRASEYAAFRKIWRELISVEEICADPKGVKVPTEASVKFAIVGSMSQHASLQNLDKLAVFVERLPAEFQTMFWMDTRKRDQKFKSTKAFQKWAIANANVVSN